MNARSIAITVMLLILSLGNIALAAEETLPAIQLPPPQTDGGLPLMQALKNRHTTREFSSEKLTDQMLSDLLWAADGINRPEEGKRTAPTAMNCQEIDIYVALPEALYLYDAKAHALQPVVAGDLRGLTGRQLFVKSAALNLVYVADLSRMGKLGEEERESYAAIDTGFIAQNVYLFCASAGLNTVTRGYVNKPKLAKAMKLKPEQKIILTQTVGKPK